MRAWATCRPAGTARPEQRSGPPLDGSVPPVLPHTVVEALLVQPSAGVSSGEVPMVCTALRTALSQGEPLDVVRPFATAEPPARALLYRQVDLAPTPDPFTVRALTTTRMASAMHPSKLTLPERQALKYLTSPLSRRADRGVAGGIPADQAQSWDTAYLPHARGEQPLDRSGGSARTQVPPLTGGAPGVQSTRHAKRRSVTRAVRSARQAGPRRRSGDPGPHRGLVRRLTAWRAPMVSSGSRDLPGEYAVPHAAAGPPRR
jgi:hypothetical protein